MVPLETERSAKALEAFQRGVDALKREAWLKGVEYGLRVADRIANWVSGLRKSPR